MEKVIKKIMVPKYVQVQSDEFKEYEIYKTTDGEEFASYYEAVEHESKLKYGEEIPSFNSNDLIDFGEIWYKARDQEELQYLIQRLSSNCQKQYNVERLIIGEWFSTTYDFDPNGPDTVTFVPLPDLKQSIKELLESLPE